MKRNLAIAAFAAVVGAIAVWNASPAGAEQAVIAQASPAPAMSASPAASASPSPSPSPTPSPKPFQVSGYIDTGYTAVSNASASHPFLNAATGLQSGNGPSEDYISGKSITGRVFDNDNQRFQFHTFNIQVGYKPAAGFGALVEYNFGDDASTIHSFPQQLSNPGTPSVTAPGVSIGPANLIDLTQAYVQYVGGPVTVQIGKFETLAGAEVIESPSDLNFSRSILFGYAVPFTHTGGRITYAVNGDLNLIAGANQGWDTTQAVPAAYDNNSLTFEYGAAWTPSKAFGLTAQGYSGPVEQGFANLGSGFYGNTYFGTGKAIRTLTDFVATAHLTPAFTAILNGDFAQQTNTILIDRTGTPFGIGTAKWDGAALYLSYTSGLFSLTGRGEYFADIGGARTGADRRWEEGTVTLAYAPNSNLIFRGEYRYDTSSNPYFASYNSTTFGSLPAYNTSGIGVEAIVKWP